MNGPAAFERMVAADYAANGYATDLTGGTNDWGVDVFATKGKEKIAIQAKMYAGARSVNRRQVFELYGAAAYFDCSGCVIATDGVLAPDAQTVANKLGVTLRLYGSDWGRQETVPAVANSGVTDFDFIWEQRIMPLAGRELTRPGGTRNQILAVDWGGVSRMTSGGTRQRIPIEMFRWVIDRVLGGGSVTREEINEQYPGRASSGIVLILSQVPEFSTGGHKLTVSLRSGPHE